MDVKTLEDEYNALLSDKAGETEYLNSLQDQIEKMKVNYFSGFFVRCLMIYSVKTTSSLDDVVKAGSMEGF